jgi:hypothetical protein
MVLQRNLMPNYPYILFNKSPEQLRRLGARGGKAQARNRRQRLLAQAHMPQREAVIVAPAETAAEAIAALDAQFPRLRGAEKRTAPVRPQRCSKFAPFTSPAVSVSAPGSNP